MNQSRRLTPIALGLAAILVLGGSIAAAAVLPSVLNPPRTAQASPEAEQAPSAEKIHRTLDRLHVAGISTTADEFGALAGKYGLGGAVRVLVFAHAAGKSTSEITAMVEAGKGWGQIRRELGISIGPGIGWIVGHGHTRGDKAHKDKAHPGTDTDDDSEGAEADDDPADD
jgi:hypothetical protein